MVSTIFCVSVFPPVQEVGDLQIVLRGLRSVITGRLGSPAEPLRGLWREASDVLKHARREGGESCRWVEREMNLLKLAQPVPQPSTIVLNRRHVGPRFLHADDRSR